MRVATLSERSARNRFQFRTAPRLPVAEHRVSSTQGRLTITRTAFAVYCVDPGMTSKVLTTCPETGASCHGFGPCPALRTMGAWGLGYQAVRPWLPLTRVHGSCRTLGKLQLYH